MKNILIIVVVLVLLGIGGYFVMKGMGGSPVVENPPAELPGGPGTGTETPSTPVDDTKTVIGTSAGGRAITAYHFGPKDAPKEILFVGGIHGGYSPNTSKVAYELMAHLETASGIIPDNSKVTIIPVLNPDGLEKIYGGTDQASLTDTPPGDRSAGRFNANDVDLNRNFDCDWQTNAVWQTKPVSGGTSAFSEPEAKAVRDYVTTHTPVAVVVYYSAAGGVFSSNCHGDVLAETKSLTNTYAKAAGYTSHEVFDFYETTGDLTNWLAKQGIPAISVLLGTHTDAEWSKNKAGVEAIFDHLGNVGG